MHISFKINVEVTDPVELDALKIYTQIEETTLFDQQYPTKLLSDDRFEIDYNPWIDDIIDDCEWNLNEEQMARYNIPKGIVGFGDTSPAREMFQHVLETTANVVARSLHPILAGLKEHLVKTENERLLNSRMDFLTMPMVQLIQQYRDTHVLHLNQIRMLPNDKASLRFRLMSKAFNDGVDDDDLM